MLESYISQTLLLAETILVGTPVAGQNWILIHVHVDGSGVEGTSVAMHAPSVARIKQKILFMDNKTGCC